MGIGWDADEVRNWKKIEDGDRFFGLGEKTGNLDKRGVEWTMWNSDTYAYGPETDPVYESIPFVLGVRRGRAWGLFFNNSHRSTFNMGAGNHRYWSFAADGGRMDYFFFYGPAVSDVVREYTALTGRTPMPPMWALGYQQSRWSYYPESEVLALARTFRMKNEIVRGHDLHAVGIDEHGRGGVHVFGDGLEPHPAAAVARQLPPVDAEIQHLLHVRRVQNRDHGVHERIFTLRGQG
jgi:alpha-glucosidase